MNSTKILFLKMLRGDIKRHTCEEMGIDPNQMSKDNEGLLTGQTIAKSDIETFPSYKLMNDDEKAIVNSIFEELKKKSEVGSNKGKAYLKQIDSLVPRSESDVAEYKDAA